MQIIYILLNFILLIFPVIYITRFIKETIEHRKRMKKISEFSDFSSNITSLIEEIKEPIARKECTEFLIKSLDFLSANSKDRIMQFDSVKVKQEMFSKWGKHIPSYVESQRDKKLEKLGI